MEFFSLLDIIVLAIGLLILGAWLFFFFKGKKNEQLFKGLDQNDFPMGDIYFIGYAITEMLKMEYKTPKARKLRKDLSALYETKYADYYIRVVYSMQFTMALTVAAFAAPMYFLTSSTVMFVFMLAASGVVYYYYGNSMKDKIQQREEELLSDFSEVVSKLALLVNSGMILSEAWERTAYSGDSTIYTEMRKSVEGIRNGTSTADALLLFGQRCMLPEIKKFASTLIQGISQGNSELAASLTQQSKEVWEMKRQLVRRKGELANNKLLIPMCVSFVGILIMIMVPIFSNLGA